MSILQIRKKSTFVWEHMDSDLGKFIVSNFFVTLDDDKFQVVEKGKAQRKKYDVSNILVYDDTVGGTAEIFQDITALCLRLTSLFYPAFDYANIPSGGGGSTGITSNLNAQFIYASGAQTFTLPANSIVLNVYLNNALITGWNISGNSINITETLIPDDQINVFGVISSSVLVPYNQTFIFVSGSQIFTVPLNTIPVTVHLNRTPVNDFIIAGNSVIIGSSIVLVADDEIIISGLIK